MKTYEELLDSAYTTIKPIEDSKERFEIPKIVGHLEGTKTILENIKEIADYIRRDQTHLIKYLLRELATSGTFKNSILILQTKVNSIKINEKIASYTKEFVICKQCNKPDTQIVKQGDFNFIHCLACGAKHSVRQKI